VAGRERIDPRWIQNVARRNRLVTDRFRRNAEKLSVGCRGQVRSGSDHALAAQTTAPARVGIMGVVNGDSTQLVAETEKNFIALRSG
jgi:hypothetical protein